MELEIVRVETYLRCFFKMAASDPRIGIVHVAVYTAILNLWVLRGCMNPITLFSWEVMPVAKISTRITYRKAIRDLNEYGYIGYHPSFSKYRGSKFELKL
jgi:hypothetical protein